MATQTVVQLALWTILAAGLANGFQFPLQYHYHYRSRVVAGIPEINEDHVAASDIRADLYVYATSPTSMIFKLGNVEIADYQGLVDCELDNELPVEYRVPTYNEPGYLIGQHAFGADANYISFHGDEPLWLTNFYKSIVGLFGIQPIRAIAFGMNNTYGTQEDAYRIKEQHVMGRCDATYTQHKMTGVALNEYTKFVEHHVTDDVQLDPAASTSKTGQKTKERKRKGTKRPPSSPLPTISVPLLDPTVWQIVRSINLEDCEDRVEHQHAPSGIHCNLATDQCKNQISRNSHGVYYIRGSSEGVRLEKAIVRGAVLVAPFGFESDMLTTNSVQKLALVSVNHLDADRPNIEGDMKQTPYLMYIMILPYNREQNPFSSWATFGTLRGALEEFTAHTITPEIHIENVARVQEMIKQAYEIITRSNQIQGPNRAPALLNYASILLYDFNQQQIEEFTDECTNNLSEGELDLLGGVLAEVGSYSSVRYLVNSFKENKISPVREAFMFQTLYKNLKSAAPLKLLLDYLKSSDLVATPFKTSQSLINFASTVNNLCMASKYSTGDSFSEYALLQCHDDNIEHDFEDYVISQLESADKFWKQMVLVKSLVNLKSKNGLLALKPYILGQKNCDKMVRLTAMQAMASWNSPVGADKEEVTLTLLEIFENPTESRNVRAKALSFLSSYSLSSTIWSRLAFSTKRPLLQDLGAFTYSLIKTTADYKHPEAMKQSLYAGHALRLAKKFSPHKRYSGFKTWYEYCFDTKIGSLNYMEKIVDPLSPLPSELSIYLRRVLGGAVMYKKLDFMIANDWGDLELIAIELFQNKRLPYQELGSNGNWDRFIDMLTSGLNMPQKIRPPVVGMVDISPINAVNFFVPLEHEFLSNMMSNLMTLMNPTKHNVLYYNSIDTTFVTVNDIGLPIIGSIAKPKIWHFKGNFMAWQSTNAEYQVECRDCSFNYGSTIRTHLETMALWSASKVSAGVSQTTTINEPIELHAHIYLPHPSKKRLGAEIKLSPSTAAGNGKVTLLNIANIPYTILRGTAPADANDVHENLKVVFSKKYYEEGKMRDQQITLKHGLVASYVSDSTNKLQDLFSGDASMFNMKPLITAKMWEIDLNMDYAHRENMEIFLNVTSTSMERDQNSGKYVSKYGQDSFEVTELCGAKKGTITTQQTGQTTYDYMDPNQQSSSNDVEYEFGSFGDQQTAQSPEKYKEQDPNDAESVRPSLGAPDASHPILDTYMPFLRSQRGWSEKIFGYSVRVSVSGDEAEGARNGAMELTLAVTFCDKLQDKRKMNYVYVFGTSHSPCDTMCLDGDMVYPKFTDMDTLKTLSQKDLTKTATYNFYMGDKCNDGPYMEANETRSFGPGDIEKFLELSTDCHSSSNDPINEFAAHAYYSKVAISLKKHKNIESPSCTVNPYHSWMIYLNNMLTNSIYAKSNIDRCLLNNDNVVRQELKSERWVGNVHRGSIDLRMASGDAFNLPIELEVPQWLEDTVNHAVNRYNSEFEAEDYCVINETSLTTFDGMHTSFSVDTCPALALTNCEAYSHDKFAVGVSSSPNGGLAVNIVARYKGQIINMDSQGVDVNGERMPENDYIKKLLVPCQYCDDSEQAGHVYKRNGFYKVELDELLSVILKEGKVYIKIAPRYNGYVCGLCGDHDNEPVNDMKQANGCFVSDAERFRKSWIPSSSFHCFSSGAETRENCIVERPMDPETYPEYTRVY